MPRGAKATEETLAAHWSQRLSAGHRGKVGCQLVAKERLLSAGHRGNVGCLLVTEERLAVSWSQGKGWLPAGRRGKVCSLVVTEEPL